MLRELIVQWNKLMIQLARGDQASCIDVGGGGSRKLIFIYEDNNGRNELNVNISLFVCGRSVGPALECTNVRGAQGFIFIVRFYDIGTDEFN